jgi:hypothetical protein
VDLEAVERLIWSHLKPIEFLADITITFTQPDPNPSITVRFESDRALALFSVWKSGAFDSNAIMDGEILFDNSFAFEEPIELVPHLERVVEVFSKGQPAVYTGRQEIDEHCKAVIAEYLPNGVVRRGDLMLRPMDALQFLDALTELDVMVNGASAWFRYPDIPGDEGQTIAEIGDCSVDWKPLAGADAVKRSAEVIRHYILFDLPERTNRVSLTTINGVLEGYIATLESN